MNNSSFSVFALGLAFAASASPEIHAGDAATPPIRHSYLVMGPKTAIIDEDGVAVWQYEPRSRDGFVLPNGNILLAYPNRVVEVTREKQIVFSYLLAKENKEIGTTQRLANGNTLVTEKGPRPRLLEITPEGTVAVQVPLQPETDNAHMQTRMARKLPNGHYLVPHLLAFAVKEYTPGGEIVRLFRTDLPELGGRATEAWPFTAIRLSNGHTVVSLTHANRVVEFDPEGRIAWQVGNDEVRSLFKDPCGVQRLANGNTVVGSHGARNGISMIEITPDRKIVWTSEHPLAAAVHEFQILTTNGRPESAPPLK